MHQIIYQQEDTYAGWPANHGAWQWGNELLVGFLTGQYNPVQWGHKVAFPLTPTFVRSYDGGETWQTEMPVKNFSALQRELIDAPELDLTNPDMILRFCGEYDHGQKCGRVGGFYMSLDRGHNWTGPYKLNGPWSDDTQVLCTTRTRYFPDKNLFFFSQGHPHQWGVDTSFVARYKDQSFELIGRIDDGNARSVMPAVAFLPDGDIITCTRRKFDNDHWIEAFKSSDQGVTWTSLGHVTNMGAWNGNPPALAYHKGQLHCVVGHRSRRSMLWFTSDDQGQTWEENVFRLGDSKHEDFGYPQLFTVGEKLLAVYYWSDVNNPVQHIAMTQLM